MKWIDKETFQRTGTTTSTSTTARGSAKKKQGGYLMPNQKIWGQTWNELDKKSDKNREISAIRDRCTFRVLRLGYLYLISRSAEYSTNNRRNPQYNLVVTP